MSEHLSRTPPRRLLTAWSLAAALGAALPLVAHAEADHDHDHDHEKEHAPSIAMPPLPAKPSLKTIDKPAGKAGDKAAAADTTSAKPPAGADQPAAGPTKADDKADDAPPHGAAKPAKPLGQLIDKPGAAVGGGEVALPDLRQRIDDRLAQMRSQRQAAAVAPVVRVASLAPGTSSAAIAGAATTAGAAFTPRIQPAGRPARAAAPPAAMPEPDPLHWSYDGPGGPAAWARLQPANGLCATGKRQSPIDIQDGIAVELEPIRVDYRPSGFRVLDNGHTVQVNVAPGNFITVGGRRYELQQFHFHRPSEERINGRQFDLVAHLVHKDIDGRLAVIAVLMDQGKAHPLVQLVWNNLPLEQGQEQAAPVEMDLAALLPEDRGYYTYMGSQTEPPCSEGVLWMVMRQPASLSPQQLAIFAKLYPMNARPLQAGNGRLIKQSQ